MSLFSISVTLLLTLRKKTKIYCSDGISCRISADSTQSGGRTVSFWVQTGLRWHESVMSCVLVKFVNFTFSRHFRLHFHVVSSLPPVVYLSTNLADFTVSLNWIHLGCAMLACALGAVRVLLWPDTSCICALFHHSVVPLGKRTSSDVGSCCTLVSSPGNQVLVE